MCMITVHSVDYTPSYSSLTYLPLPSLLSFFIHPLVYLSRSLPNRLSSHQYFSLPTSRFTYLSQRPHPLSLPLPPAPTSSPPRFSLTSRSVTMGDTNWPRLPARVTSAKPLVLTMVGNSSGTYMNVTCGREVSALHGRQLEEGTRTIRNERVLFVIQSVVFESPLDQDLTLL